MLVAGCTASIKDKNYALGHYQVTNLVVDSRLLPTGKQADLPQALAAIETALSQQLPRPAGSPPVTMHVEITSMGVSESTYTPLNAEGRPTKDEETTTTYRIVGIITLLSPTDGHVIGDSIVLAEEKIGKSYENSSFGETFFDNLLWGYSSEPNKPALYDEFTKQIIHQFYLNS